MKKILSEDVMELIEAVQDFLDAGCLTPEGCKLLQGMVDKVKENAI